MCNIVCNIKLDAKTAKDFKEKISDEYRVNMYDMRIVVLLFSASILLCDSLVSYSSAVSCTGFLITFL